MIDDALAELSYDLEEDGVLVRKQLDRAVLSAGGWATVMFLYAELDRRSGRFGAPKVAVVRFRKARGGYRKHSAFTLASQEQARELGGALARWMPRLEEQGRDRVDDPDPIEDRVGARAHDRFDDIDDRVDEDVDTHVDAPGAED